MAVCLLPDLGAQAGRTATYDHNVVLHGVALDGFFYLSC